MSLHHPLGLSCKTCQSRKRKCDKRQPKCGLCERKNLPCVYTAESQSKKRFNPDLLRQQSVFERESWSPATKPNPNNNINERAASKHTDFPSVLFLDPPLSRQYHIEIPNVNIPVPPDIISIIGGTSHQHAIAKSFFENIHEWIPIVSKSHLYEHLNPLCPLSADYALLILCMDLISWIPEYPASPTHTVRTPTYLAAKRCYLDLEVAGIASIQVLQAGILIAIFELGHSIYPSAYLSVGSCVRYASVLGIGWRTSPSATASFTMFEEEERNRSWWAIVLLDRIVSIGRPEPALISDPGLDAILPGSDAEWEQGCPTTLYSVATPAIQWGDMGAFSLVAQATRLLSLVLKHISDPQNLDEEEAILLDGTLRSLSQVVMVEGQLRDLHFMNQQAICSIAIMILHETYASQPGTTKTSAYFAAIHHISSCTLDIEESLAPVPARKDHMSATACAKDSSPFLVTLLYQCACASERLHRENPTDKSLQNIECMRKVFILFDTRWKAAGAYLKVLEAREMFFKR